MATKKPNILVIWGDDLGRQHQRLPPRLMGGGLNIDRLATAARYSPTVTANSRYRRRASFTGPEFRTGLLTTACRDRSRDSRSGPDDRRVASHGHIAFQVGMNHQGSE
jgi:arylsulfatase A-like enzyme